PRRDCRRRYEYRRRDGQSAAAVQGTRRGQCPFRHCTRGARRPGVNAHALGVLELPRVLELVAQRATSSLGAARIRSALPRPEREWVEREQSRLVGVRALMSADDPWSPEPIPDLTAALTRLRIEGTSWSGTELLSGAV